MKGTTIFNDFKGLKDALAEVRKNNPPAETQYEKQAKKMGYTKDPKVVVEQSISEASAFDGMTKIVNDKQAQKVGGIMIDMFTASVILKAYTKVNASNKEKMKKANVHTLVALAQKVMGLNAAHEFEKDPLKGFPYNETNESIMSEGGMSDMLIDIQQGASAKELSKTYKMPLSIAKNFLKSYYGQKKGPRTEGFASDAQRKAAFANGYKEKGKKGKKEDIKHKCATHVEHSVWGSGTTVSGEHDLVEQEDGSHQVKHYTVEFSHGIEEMVSIYELNITKEADHEHHMSKTAGRKKLQSRKESVNEAGMGDKIGKLFKTTDKKEIDGISNLMNMTDIKVLQSMMKQNPKGFKKMAKKMGELPAMEEVQEETIQEGTWAIPSTIEKMKKFQGILQRPMFAKNKASVEKFKNSLYSLIGDDELFDVYDGMIIDKEFNGENMVELLVKSLEGRWFNFKKKGKGWVATHQYFPMEPEDEDDINAQAYDMGKKGNAYDEGKGRPTGFYKPKKKIKVEDKLDPVGKGDDDIDNDGDSDDSDDYLKNRRKKISKAMKMKENNDQAKRSPFKLKSKQYPRALGIETEGYGVRHASESDLIEACNSFGMITEQELQLEQLQKTLGKSGFLTYNISELNDLFDDRETERMILAMESIIPEDKLEKVEYDRETIDRALEEELDVEFVKPDGMKALGPVLKMCENTYNLKDKYTGKSFTFKYTGEDMKTFNEIISEAKFPKKLVQMAGGIAFDKRYVGGNMTGAVNAIEKLKKGLSDDPKVRDMLRLANESFNNNFYNMMSEEDKTAYQKFFQSAMKKFGVSSPGELEGDKEKEFYNYIDKNWKGDDEKKESVEEGKYTAYSDLLLMKARIIAAEGPKSDKLPAVNSQIKIVMKRLGVKEEGGKVDGRRSNFREKMKKLKYIKSQSY